jgi:hypothetical protein
MVSDEVSKLLAKHCSLALFAIVFLASAGMLAEAKELHNGWHYNGDTFNVDQDVILVTHLDFYSSTVLLQVNQNTFILRAGECKETGTKDYCVIEIFQDINTKDANAHIKFLNGKAYAGINIVVRTRGPDLKVTRTLSTSTPELGQDVTATVHIINDGNEPTDSFVYTETLSPGAEITSLSRGTNTARTVIYNFDIPVFGDVTFSYSFKISDYLDISLTPTVYYMYSGNNISVAVSATNIKVPKPYLFSASASPTSYEYGGDSVLKAKIDNKVSQRITIDELVINIPALLSVKSSPSEMQMSESKYKWQGILETTESKEFSMTVKPTKSGTYKIPVTVKLRDYDGKSFSETINVSVTATISPIQPTLLVKESVISEGSIYRVSLAVTNPNKNTWFRNIVASLKSPAFPELIAGLSELIPGKSQSIIVNDSLMAPYTGEKKIYTIEAYGEYETSSKEIFNFSQKTTLTVNPVNQILNIGQQADKQTVVAGNNVTMTITITYNNKEPLQVNVNDQFTEGAKLVGGKTIETLSFFDSGSQQAYTYKIKVPVNYSQNQLVVTTFTSIPEKYYMLNKTMIINVTGPPPPEKINQTINNQTANQSQAEAKEVKKPGFFKRIITAILEFFNRIM